MIIIKKGTMFIELVFVMLVSQKIGKPNNLNVCSRKKTKDNKQDRQNRLRFL